MTASAVTTSPARTSTAWVFVRRLIPAPARWAVEGRAARFAQDGEGLRERREDEHAVRETARLEALGEEEGQLVRSGRTGVRRSEDPDDDPTAGELGDPTGRLVRPGAVVGVEGMGPEPRDAVEVALGAEGDDEGVPADPLETAARGARWLEEFDLGSEGSRVDGRDRGPPDVDAAVAEPLERPLAGCVGLDAGEGPVLAEAHREGRPPLHEDDLVGGVEEPSEGHGGGDAAEAAAEDEGASHGRVLVSWSSLRSIFLAAGANLLGGQPPHCRRPRRSSRAGVRAPEGPTAGLQPGGAEGTMISWP
jgi:hypothetical protein